MLTRGPGAVDARHPAVGILQTSAKVDSSKVDSSKVDASKDSTCEACGHTDAGPACRPEAFFFTLATGPRRSLSLKLSDTRVYEPQIRARLLRPVDIWSRHLQAWELARRRGTRAPRRFERIFFFFTLVTGSRRSLSLKMSDTRVYEPQIRSGKALPDYVSRI